MQNVQKKRRGIALAGGGARGAYQIGALKALKEEGHLEDIHAVSGSSIGSVNACMLATDALEKAERIWLTLNEKDLLKNQGNIIRRIFTEGVNLVKNGVYHTDRFYTMLGEIIDFERLKERDVHVAVSHVGGTECNLFELMSLNVRDFFQKGGRIRYFNLRHLDEEAVKQTILASCAVPVFFRPVVIGEDTYYDGGVLDNTPIRPLLDAGCEEIIVIDLFRVNLGRKKSVDGVPLYHFYPRRHLRGVLNFDARQIERRFALGYEETKARLEQNLYPI